LKFRLTNQISVRWIAVALGFLVLALAFSARATLGLLMPTWETELGWSRSFISGIGAMALVVMAMLAPFVGVIADRTGPRLTLSIGLVVLAIGFFTIAITSNAIVFGLAFGGLSAVAFGMVSTTAVGVAITKLFPDRLGVAIGVATSGATAGQFVIVPLIAISISYVSWRWSIAGIALCCLLLVPITWRLLAGTDVKPTSQKSESMQSWRDAARILPTNLTFHLLFWSFFLCGYTTTGVIETHFLPYASYCGFPPVTGAAAFGLLSAVNMLGMIGAGWLADKVNRPLLLGGIYLARGLAFLLLMNVGSDIETLYLFSAIFGLVDYSTLPVTVSLVASHLGKRVMGLSLGLIAAGHALGGALGAFLGGYLFDVYEQYQAVWVLSLLLTVLAGMIVFFLRDTPSATDLRLANS